MSCIVVSQPYKSSVLTYSPLPNPNLNPNLKSNPQSLVAPSTFYCFHSFAFQEGHRIGIKQNLLCSDWLLSLTNMILRFLCVFLWLGSSFFFKSLNHILLSICTTVYLSICLLKNILVTPVFWQLWKKAAIDTHLQIFCEHKFSTRLGRYEGARLPDGMVRICLVL